MKTILVVDDEEAVVEFIGLLLEDAGYHVLRAYDGRKAFEVALREHPDLIVTDIMMPIMNGMELCRLVRDTPETENIPIILMTAGRVPTQECPNTTVLPKPFDLSTLEKAIERILPPRPAS